MSFLARSSLRSFVQLLALSHLSRAYPSLVDDIRARQINVGDLAASYDYIVVGGGQSGLVIANRLSEDSSKTVLIVEYGYLDNNPSQLEPASSVNYPTRDMFNVTAVAQTAIGNKRPSVYAASVVGGGSTINGMLFDRGAAEDYDNWAKLGNTGWDWAGIYPYFKKSTKFTPPSAALAQENGITWDASAYGNGPINVTYPPWVWPTIKVQFAAFNDVGVPKQVEGSDGHAYNAFWVPSNVEPTRITRSYARNGYFDPVASRPNLKLLVGYRVNEVKFDASKRAESVTIQERGTANGVTVRTVRANIEIVLCAGWLHTPQILQRSGVGPKALLQQAGIPVVVDLPGVGANLQDHPVTSVNFNYQRNLFPNPSSSQTNQTFAAWATQEWQQFRRGPLSLGTGNSMAIIPLPVFHPGYQATITKALAQNAASFLPSSYTAETIRGFLSQRSVLMDSFSSLTNGITEIPFGGTGGNAVLLEKPLSRGTVLLNTQDRYAEPIVDYQTNINPVDADLFVAMVKFYRRWMAAASMQQLGPVEQTPGTSVSSDQQLRDWVASSVGSTTAHTCCSAHMGPRDDGGVLSPELLVYGVTGLSVGDISLIPLIPATHTCATVYAIAEKAADLIKARIVPVPSSSISTSSTSSQVSTSISTTSSIPTTTISSTTTTTTSVPTTTAPAGPAQTHWGQCGGAGWAGPKTCASPWTCKYSHQWYSQCL